MVARVFVWVSLCLVMACEAEREGVPVSWPSLSDRADYGGDVPIRGALALDVPHDGTTLAPYEGWTLRLEAGAVITVEVTHGGTSRAADIALAIYGPTDDEGRRALLATDDDAGWGKLPRIRDFAAAERGDYLVVLARLSTSVAKYRLVARCTSAACAPAPAVCDVGLLAGMRGCARAAEDVDVYDAALQCADAEALGRVHAVECARPDAPAWCALPYERFFHDEVPRCAEALMREAAYEACVLGSTWYELTRSPWVHVAEKVRLDPHTPLADGEAARVVSAVQASSHTDVSTSEDAFARVDEGVIERYTLVDASADRSFVAYIYGAGDSTYGRVFAGDTIVSSVHDGELMDCDLPPGPIGRDCRAHDDCASGLACLGLTDAARGLGRCGAVHTQRADEIDGIPIIGATFERMLVVYGLSGQADEVEVELALEHPDAPTIVAWLVTPDGHMELLASGAEGGFIETRVALRMHGPANGEWRLRLEGMHGAGTLYAWSVRVTSRP